MPSKSTTLATLVAVLALSSDFVQAAPKPSPTKPKRQTYSKTLDITNKLVSPDGFERLAVVAGGSLPGPLLTTKKGDNFKIKVVDKLTEAGMLKTTSVHWHGLFQRGTAWADGTGMVTQCPIASGHDFTYEFSAGEHTNTFWYHSHHELQYCDGLRGGIVIYDDQDPHKGLYDVDDASTVITLMDWYHDFMPVVGPFQVADSTLINGKGRFVGGPSVPLSIINVECSKRYRIRLISLSCDANFQFSIDGHTDLTVIETDGINTKPVKAESLTIYAGQRYSFVLNANQPKGNYWVRALPNHGPQGYENGVNMAILRYKGAPTTDPTSVQTVKKKALVSSALAPLVNPAAPGIPELGKADVNIRLEVGVNMETGLFNMNGVPYTSPSVPVLLQVLSGAASALDLMPSGSVYVLPKDKVVEITLVSLDALAPHPFHLHGHTFSVIKGPEDTVPNFVNPPRRDVYNAGGGNQTTVIRFVTNNAGPWMFHCHVEHHAVHGMSVIFVEEASAIVGQKPPPAAFNDLCPIYNALPPSEL
ncbi:laccase [Pterulicium gracile]|uniref:laccase n=1 Tax=Pterulicium gracile TaxID=1884261 RepID=A0A5C3QCW9_9AGAR|nr:laccase [Pterula gracilis]